MNTNPTPDAGDLSNQHQSNTGQSTFSGQGAPQSPFQNQPYTGPSGDQFGGGAQQPGAPQPGAQATYGAVPPQPNPSGFDDRTAAMIAHLSAPIAAFVSVGWLGFVGPLLVWLFYKDKSPFVRTAAAEAFNFQITMWLASIIGWVLCFTIILLPIGILLILLSGLAAIIFGIWGAVKTSSGEQYRYPWNLPLLK